MLSTVIGSLFKVRVDGSNLFRDFKPKNVFSIQTLKALIIKMFCNYFQNHRCDDVNVRKVVTLNYILFPVNLKNMIEKQQF
jgi:hypothetical protein